ncbi:hypothetical protein H5410_047090 [Solanum commersonii]|uniref:DUF4283 domain-containing protein n=1 Tax=Solanum commersonii TaxID=4109 RepID=A0A9J5XI72_SOLCO|nr:hypothetical protein H5410_047090 [Solanum commersonii]
MESWWFNWKRRMCIWKWKSGKPDLFYHDESYYVVKFHTIKDLNEVYYTEPYSINNRPIIFKPWTPNFSFKDEFPYEISLWVVFPNLPMHYSEESR